MTGNGAGLERLRGNASTYGDHKELTRCLWSVFSGPSLPGGHCRRFWRSGLLEPDCISLHLTLFSPCGSGACFGQTRISVGKANQRLTYADQVLQLTYEGGSPCPSKTGQTYKSVISFVCRPEAGPTNRPMLVSLDKQTCTLFFSWHTPLACEQVVSLP